VAGQEKIRSVQRVTLAGKSEFRCRTEFPVNAKLGVFVSNFLADRHALRNGADESVKNLLCFINVDQHISE
jgi:hypothetical protein